MNVDQNTLVHARLARDQAVRDWINDPNVMLIDIGWPEHGGTLATNELAIRVHVVQKFTEGLALEAAQEEGLTGGLIPDSILGFPVDRPEGTYGLHQWISRRRRRRQTNPRAQRTNPMEGGISISNARKGGYGTLGGLVIDRDTDAQMILSNWHVLAADWRARRGWPIYQPGRGDGGRRTDTVAKLLRHAMASNLDAAVAELTGSRQLINDQFDLLPARGVGWAQLGMEVVKSGRRTGITRGRVTAVEGVINLDYAGNDRLIANVITIEPRWGGQVSAGGDSGSFWFHEKSMNAIGLHFAGSDRPERALAIDMQPILDALNVNLAVGL